LPTGAQDNIPDMGCEVVYGDFHFAETIGLVAYQAKQSAPTDHLLGEWCFAGLYSRMARSATNNTST
jgi:hypothetical protein